MRLIDADRLLEPRRIGTYYHLPNGDIAIPLIDIEHAPAIDAVPVVRCKDCKHYKIGTDGLYYCYNHDDDILWQDDDYCSRGERKEE